MTREANMALDHDSMGDLMPESIIPRDQWDRERMADMVRFGSGVRTVENR